MNGELGEITSTSHTKKKKSDKESEHQGREASSNKCASCFGLYEDDVNPETGNVMCDWIQCTSENCITHGCIWTV